MDLVVSALQANNSDSLSASLQAGLAVISILARGNDYLPGVGQLSLTSTQSRNGVWSEYLKLKQQPEWIDRYKWLYSPVSSISCWPFIVNPQGS